MAFSGTGTVQLSLIMKGQENVRASLQSAQKGLDDTGNAAKRLGGDTDAGVGKMEGIISGLPGRITDIKSAFDLVSGAISTVTGFVQGMFDQIREGEKALNVDTIFRQMVDNADDELQRLRDASANLVDDTSLQQATNRLRLLGFETRQIATLLDAAIKTQIATGDDWKSTLDQLSRAIASGREATLDRLGVVVDLNAETERAAVAAGKATEEFTKQELISIHLAAVSDTLARKLEAIDFDAMATSVQETDTALANALSNFQVWLASNEEAAGAVKTSSIAIADSAVSLDAYSERLEELAATIPGMVGQATTQTANALRSLAAQVEADDAQLARALRGNADLTIQSMELTATQAEELVRTLERLALRRREIARQELDDAIGARAQRMAIKDAEEAEINAAVDAEDAAAEEAARRKEQADRDREAAAKAAAARMRAIRNQSAQAELELERLRMGELSALDRIEMDRRAEILRIEQQTDASAAGRRLAAQRIEIANLKAAAATKAVIQQEEARAKQAADREAAQLEDLAYQIRLAQVDRAGTLSRAALDRDREIASIRRAMLAEQISAEVAAEEERLAMARYAGTIREEEARRAREAADATRAATEETLAAYDQLASGLARAQSTTARLFATTARLAAITAARYKDLAAGSTAAILAVANVGAEAIASERVRAGAMAAVAFATALLELARGNAAGAAAGFASAAAFTAFAGSSGGSRSTGAGAGLALAPATPGGQAAGAGAQAFAPQGSGGEQTLIVEGWSGQDLVGQLAGEVERSRRNGVDRRRL